MIVDIKKQYRTKDGRDVRILCTDDGGEASVVGVVAGLSAPQRWKYDGKYLQYPGAGSHGLDLVEATPPLITGYMPIWLTERNLECLEETGKTGAYYVSYLYKDIASINRKQGFRIFRLEEIRVEDSQSASGRISCPQSCSSHGTCGCKTNCRNTYGD